MKLRSGKETEWKRYVDNNSTDPYSKACVDYAETWANLMERDIARGEKLHDIAEESSHEADNDGITGFMYGAAVKMLSDCWEWGEDLRRWHNIKYQIVNEGVRANDSGEVLNPAVVSIDTDRM